MKQKPTSQKVGSIGTNDVMLYGDAHCLVVNTTWLSAGKIKAVLANLEACRQFLLKYDAPATPEPAKPNPAAELEKAELIKRIKDLEAKAAAAAISSNGHNRLDPIKTA